MRHVWKKLLYTALMGISLNALAGLGEGRFVSTVIPERATESTALPTVVAAPKDTARVKVKRTAPLEQKDLDDQAVDLRTPENIKTETVYDETTNSYLLGGKLGDSYLNAPILMSEKEYQQWSLKKSIQNYYRTKNDAAFLAKGKEKFDFTDMKFDLGPAEKIFGPGGVQIKTQGSAELKVGGNLKKVDNPSLSINRRKTFAFDFDEKINLSLTGKVGDKLNMKMNYNTDATFDFDTKNLKLHYDGKEDEIVKLVEAGNVSFPSNVSLIQGASSLFGFRTDLQFGKLGIQAVLSQKKSSSKSVSSKGGTQTTEFEVKADDYEENRHFFLAHFFRDRYDNSMANLPNITSGVHITRVEVWITNKTATQQNLRNLIGFTDLAEHDHISNTTLWHPNSTIVPANQANTLYDALKNNTLMRDIDQTNQELDRMGLAGGIDYEKLQSARKLNTSEYTLNTALGYISLKTTLQTDEVLAVAFEYTYGGQTFQVGEFSTDVTDSKQALMVKTLKNTANTPTMGNWKLMMRNIYSLGATNIQKEKFRLDIKYLSDTTGVYLSYLPDMKDKILLRLMNLDRLNSNNKLNPDGQFDFVNGSTINSSTGRIIFPVVEPFGSHLRKVLNNSALADKYCFQELYDSTKTVAKQIAEKDKFILTGRYKGSNGAEIILGSTNIPQGSVVVTAGGQTLTENTDYTVDYSSGIVTIINQSIIDAGTNVNVSLESESEYAEMRKTMVGLNLKYDFTPEISLGGTFMHLSEQALTTKVSMGNEPLNNTIWGLNFALKKESQWLTDMLDKLPLIHCTAPSQITFNAEFAQLIAHKNKDVQGEASYIDDFENSMSGISLLSPTSWMLASTPTLFNDAKYRNDLRYGNNRALLSWYTIDPLFTNRSSSLTPSHIKGDLTQLSNHYIREVYERELYPTKQISSSSNESSTLPVMNMAFYPSERGPYNLDTDLNTMGYLNNPTQRWGGMMCRLGTTDFEQANIEYIEFWMMDPFRYSGKTNPGGDLYFDLGEVSEDVLKDGKKFAESAMPTDGNKNYLVKTLWGQVPTSSSTTYAFNTSSGARSRQDVGLNGFTTEEEQGDSLYQDYLTRVQKVVSNEVFPRFYNDPAGDNYHYFRGSDYDEQHLSVLERYKHINGPEGNSPDTDSSPESYDTSYKTSPDVEDINQDFTLNEYEKYYQYKVSIRPEDMRVGGDNFIVDKRTASVKLRNDEVDTISWYLFRIPIKQYTRKEGNISGYNSIRFVRMFMTEFSDPTVLRFATLELKRGTWRSYEQALYNGSTPATSGEMAVSNISLEENGDKQPVNYVMPPSISRVVDPSQPQLTEDNEQALSIVVKDLAPGDARAVYKNVRLDLRSYRHIQMFIHANALLNDHTALQDGQTSVFIRFGSDYKSNFYEYEIPLKLTPSGSYGNNNGTDRTLVWPIENMLDIDLKKLTDVKRQRNTAKSRGQASYTSLYYAYDNDHPNNKVSVMGNPSLGEIHTIMIGIRNNSRAVKSTEVWVNELRLQDYTNQGGYAAQGNLNVQLSDLGTVALSGHLQTAGFGGLEQRVAERKDENEYQYTVTTSFDLGKLLPEKVKLVAPIYYSYSKEHTSPKYNPLDTDMLLDEALDACATKSERDSLKDLTTHTTTNKNFSLSGVKLNIATPKHPMPYDPANFSFSYSHSSTYNSGETTAWESDDHWRGNINYSWSPSYKPFEPFKKRIKSKSPWLKFFKELNFNYLPQSVVFNTDMTRNYYELQERDLENLGSNTLPLVYSEQFLWNRDFAIKWDFTKSLHTSFSSGTKAEIQEPDHPINKNLYPDEYSAWKDSVWRSIQHMGRPLSYDQSFDASYQLPLNKFPIFDWLDGNVTYHADYSWTRGTEMTGGTSMGHTITTQRNISGRGNIKFETLYNKIPFLKAANERFSSGKTTNKAKWEEQKKKKQEERKKAREEAKQQAEAAANQELGPDGKPLPAVGPDGEPVPAGDMAKAQPGKKQPKGFNKVLTILPDSNMTLAHGQKSKRILVSAITTDGKRYPLKFKVKDDNTIIIKNKKDSLSLKINVQAKPKLEESTWYTMLQGASRVLMMVRSANINYTNRYSLSLPGFAGSVGDILGQRREGGMFQPGLDFAFGLVDDDYVKKAKDREWLISNDSISSPATSNTSSDLQLKLTLEPLPNFKIDLNAQYTRSRAHSIQFMYKNSPSTETGSFSMTTIAIGSAFQSQGTADNGYKNATFDKFISYLDAYQQRVEAQYAGARYPAGTTLAGQTFNPANGTVSPYSSDVMIPAFLAAYTGGGISRPLDIFPALTRLLPNWSISYGGLAKIPQMQSIFKSFNINHSYKCVYSVGSYNTFSSFHEFMDDLGFVDNVKTGNPTPSMRFDVSAVSINESFSPLIGVNMTFQNNMTAKAEYRTTRVLNLSTTSAQITENGSKDIVVGLGYKVNNFKIFGNGKNRRDKSSAKRGSKNAKNTKDNKEKETAQNTSRSSRGVNNDLSLNLDFSLRNQSTLTRSIQTALSEATSGNQAIKIAFTASYTLSKMITLSAFYDFQNNRPLLTSSSYPTITQDFGFSMRFSLTR